jgi:hypothetical protein
MEKLNSNKLKKQRFTQLIKSQCILFFFHLEVARLTPRASPPAYARFSRPFARQTSFAVFLRTAFFYFFV